MQRVDLGASWVIPKPSLRRGGALLRHALVGFVVLLLGASLQLEAGSAATQAAARQAGEVHPAVMTFIVIVVGLVLLALLVAETRSTLGSVAVLALLGLASAALPRGGEFWTGAGVVGCFAALMLVLAAFLLFAHLYRTRDGRQGRKTKNSKSKDGGGGAAGCGGCGAGCGGGCGGCGG